MIKSSTLIYIHGFNSSPQAYKAQLVSDYLSQKPELLNRLNYLVPLVDDEPDKAIADLTELVEQELHRGQQLNKGQQVALIGSSLGGYYSAYLAERFGLRAVLVNPAAHAGVRFEQYLGEQYNPYSQRHYHITREHLQALSAIDVEAFSAPDRIQIMVQEGDEVLDYREILTKYPQCPKILESGGDHHFIGFERHISAILAFLNIA